MTTLLLVEDNEMIRNHLIHIIKRKFNELTLLTAATGEKAIELLKEKKIDIFFLDIELPDISGMEIAQQIRSIEEYEFSFIVFITGYTFMLKDALQKYNCYDFIEKPFSEEKIVKTVDKLLKGVNKEKVTERKNIKIENGVYLHKVYLEDIFFIEIHTRVLHIHTSKGIMNIPNMTIQKIMDLLQEVGGNHDFMRSHRSYCINISKFYSLKQENKRIWEIHFENYDGVALLSHKYKDKLLEEI